VDVNALASKLQKDGAQAFVKSWQQLLQRIKDKASALADKSKGSELI
jgi:transaldolase